MPVLSWLQIGGGAVAAFAVSWLLHSVDVNRIEAKWHGKLTAQETALRKSCDDDKAITEAANASYQKQVGDITLKFNKYRMYAAKCVSVATNTPKLPASGGKPSRSDGLTVDWLRNFAATCETYRSQRLTTDQYFNSLKP